MHKRQFQVRKTHHCGALLDPKNPSYKTEILFYTLNAISRDIEPDGDITTQLFLDEKKDVSARIIAKSSGVLAGMQEASFFLSHAFSNLSFRTLKKDGAMVQKNDVIALVKGSVGDILKVERTLLNLLQRMSGIATLTAKFVDQIPRSVLLVPTRKTLWGLLDKRACTVGGGGTHRLNLSDAVLVKDTHLDFLKHDFEKLFQILIQVPLKGRFIEIEVETEKEAFVLARLAQKYRSVLKKPLIVMFDNMRPELIKKILRHLKKENLFEGIYFEASGGINLKNVRQYAGSGVDIVSVGAITHSAPALDISLKIFE